jgi:hypothetical protein
MKIYILTAHKADPNGGEGTTEVMNFGWTDKAIAEAYKDQHEVYYDTQFEVHEIDVI